MSAYDPDRAFARAQREYDNQTPPEGEWCEEHEEFDCEDPSHEEDPDAVAERRREAEIEERDYR